MDDRATTENIQMKSASRITRQILVGRFPNCFAPKGSRKSPLAIGIHNQVFEAAPDLSKRSVRIALADYINGPKYLNNVIEGASRINLDGSAAGIVTSSEAAYAERRIKTLESLWRKQRSTQRAKHLKTAA